MPQLHVRPCNAEIAVAAVSRVRSNLVVKAAPGRIIITEHLFAIDVDAVLLQTRIVHRIDANTRANLGHPVGNRLAALGTVQATALLDGHDEVRAGIAVERLFDGDAGARHGVDFKRAAELVRARRIIVLVPALGAEMTVGAAGAASAAIGRLGDGKGVAADFAALALLCAEAGAVLDPVAASHWATGDGQCSSRDG